MTGQVQEEGEGQSRSVEMDYPCGRLKGLGPEESRTTSSSLLQSGDKQGAAWIRRQGWRDGVGKSLGVPVCR